MIPPTWRWCQIRLPPTAELHVHIDSAYERRPSPGKPPGTVRMLRDRRLPTAILAPAGPRIREMRARTSTSGTLDT